MKTFQETKERINQITIIDMTQTELHHDGELARIKPDTMKVITGGTEHVATRTQ